MKTLKTVRFVIVRSRKDKVTGKEFKREIVGAFQNIGNAKNYFNYLVKSDVYNNVYVLQEIDDTELTAVKEIEDPETVIIKKAETQVNYFAMEEWGVD